MESRSATIHGEAAFGLQKPYLGCGLAQRRSREYKTEKAPHPNTPLSSCSIDVLRYLSEDYITLGRPRSQPSAKRSVTNGAQTPAHYL